MRTKSEVAADYIRSIRDMDADVLQQVIVNEAGEDLAAFLFAYASKVMQKESAGASAGAVQVLILMGYLIARNEDKVLGNKTMHMLPQAKA
jgi:hypothetical protein